MAVSRQSNASFNAAVKSFVGVARRSALAPDEVEQLLNEIASVIRSEKIAEFQNAVTLVLEMSPSAIHTPLVADAPLMAKPVAWKTHKDNKSGKATHYTATWEGLKLRVERVKIDNKVIFIGYINETEILRGKSRVVVRAEIESEARRLHAAKT